MNTDSAQVNEDFWSFQDVTMSDFFATTNLETPCDYYRFFNSFSFFNFILHHCQIHPSHVEQCFSTCGMHLTNGKKQLFKWYSNCTNAHRLLLSTNAHCLIYNK